MGLFKAAGQAISTTFGDQFLSGIYCEDMGNEILMKRIDDKNGTIAKGSRIIVAPGQVAVLYDNGKILDATAEPGVYTFDSSSTPSFFGGNFGKVFKEMWERFKFGGDIAKEQAVFYFNTKEIIGNKFGTSSPIPYKDWGHPLLNARMGGYSPMRLDIKCYGTYTFKITNPALFMEKVSGISHEYTKEDLIEQMRSEVVASFTNVLNNLCEDEYKIEALSLPNKTDEIKKIMSESVFDSAIRERGVSLISFAVESVTLTDESKKKIDEYELAGDQYQQQGVLTSAYANAIQNAASNSKGVSNGFMGIGMMNMASGNTFGGVTSNVANNVQYANPSTTSGSDQTFPLNDKKTEETWICKCGANNKGKFCSECGAPKNTKKVCPKCKCEIENDDKFCSECGEKLI